MTSSSDDLVRNALGKFAQARESVYRTFGARSAADVVSAVVEGRMPREGENADGSKYYVHGVGYTVILRGEGEVHLDGGSGDDVFSVYDVLNYFESLNLSGMPTLGEIRAALDNLAAAGLVEVAKNRFVLPRAAKGSGFVG